MELRSRLRRKKIVESSEDDQLDSDETYDEISVKTQKRKKKSRRNHSLFSGKMANLIEGDEKSYSTSSNEQPMKKYKCEICPKSFDRRPYLSDHMNSHTKERPIECEFCSKTFLGSGTLFNHRKSHFPPMLKCDFCPKMFTLKRGLEQHMNLHKGEKPFKCDKCDERFAHSCGLSQHRKKHSEPQFSCPYCEKKFFQAAHCMQHWKGTKNRQIACKVRSNQLATQNS